MENQIASFIPALQRQVINLREKIDKLDMLKGMLPANSQDTTERLAICQMTEITRMQLESATKALTF